MAAAAAPAPPPPTPETLCVSRADDGKISVSDDTPTFVTLLVSELNKTLGVGEPVHRVEHDQSTKTHSVELRDPVVACRIIEELQQKFEHIGRTFKEAVASSRKS